MKNLFIFCPVFFALRITEWDIIISTLLAFGGFSLFASAVYILNDYIDRGDDRKHPEKKFRPLASGAIGPKGAFSFQAILLIVGAVLLYLSDPLVLALGAGYVVMNILYCIKLKQIPVIDIFIIAIGFVIRLFVGSLAGDIELSMWIILITFLLALFLGLAKRRADVLLSANGKEVRKSIKGYNLEFVNGGMILMAAVFVVSYISYTISPVVQAKFDCDKLYLTVFFVLLGLLRYMQITFVEERSGSPTKVLLTDLFLQLTLIGWVIAFVLLIY